MPEASNVLEPLRNREPRMAAIRRLRLRGQSEGIEHARIAATERSLETAFALADTMDAIREAVYGR